MDPKHRTMSTSPYCSAAPPDGFSLQIIVVYTSRRGAKRKRDGVILLRLLRGANSIGPLAMNLDTRALRLGLTYDGVGSFVAACARLHARRPHMRACWLTHMGAGVLLATVIVHEKLAMDDKHGRGRMQGGLDEGPRPGQDKGAAAGLDVQADGLTAAGTVAAAAGCRRTAAAEDTRKVEPQHAADPHAPMVTVL